MSMNIYAGIQVSHPAHGQIWEPIIDFSSWDAEIMPADADERYMRGEDVDYIPNPAYIPNAGMSLSNGNARLVMETLGLAIDDEGFGRFEIAAVQKAALRGLNGAAALVTRDEEVSTGTFGATFITCALPDDYMRTRIEKLLAIVVEGQKRGATHIIVC